ncbi:MAG: GTPase HflX [Acidobacteria bacterium]|nr:GTPase HflX [Acidobacteriota bacterium]
MKKKERALLVGICRSSRERLREQESLQELTELAESAGAEVTATFIQEKAHPDPAFLVGAGKLEQIRSEVLGKLADLVIFDEDLTPAQLRNLENRLETKVVDRSELILDIFAQRARSREGKLQVELAQLEYLLPRLTGKGQLLSRLGGGIGTRGPGETKLEVDRRTIRGRIARVRRELERLEKRRSLQRQKRKSIPIPVISLAGYTNAGKSTLFKRLTRQETYVSPRMFATLDPLVRKLRLPGGHEVLLSDTVGFVRKLPPTLVAAFHATLEETLEADLILHVIDCSHENYGELRAAVYDVLREIGLVDTPVLEVYNKIDLVREPFPIDNPCDVVFISALTGEGVDRLLQKIEELIGRHYRRVSMTLPMERGDLLSQLRERALIESEEYHEDGIWLRAQVPLPDLGRFQEFLNFEDVSISHRRKA